MSLSLSVILGLMLCIEATGSSAVTPVFVKRGDDVLLEVMDNDPKEFDILVWRFNTSNVLLRYSPGRRPRVSEGYTGRVEFSVENYSVKLKNLQDADSGVYTAQMTGDKEQTIAEYMVTVQGSSAVTPVFVKRGDDVLLEVMDNAPKEYVLLIWKFNTSNVLVGYSPGGRSRVSEGYTGRVEFSVENYSVKLKNLQDADSGVYTALVSGDEDQTIAEYMVTVQGPVSPVDLNPDSVSISSDSCNLTVTCSTEDSDISSTFRCDTKTCSQEGGEQSKVTNSGASLRVHLLNETIICNHSNQVRWTKKMAKIQDFCSLRAGLSDGVSICLGPLCSLLV